MEQQNLNKLLETFTDGKFITKLCVVVSLAWFLDGSELMLLSILTTQLKRTWSLTYFEGSVIYSSFFVGSATGSFFWGWLADRHGRRNMLLSSISLVFYFGFLTAATTDYRLFSAARFFVGFGTGGTIFAPVYMAEYVEKKSRGRFMIALSFVFSLGGIFVAALAYFFMNTYGWKVFVLMIAVTPPIVLLYSIWLPESAMYLQNNGRFDDVMKILHRISTENRKVMPTSDVSLKADHAKHQGNISVLFSKSFRRSTACLTVIWIADLVTYFSIAILNTKLMDYPVCTKFDSAAETNRIYEHLTGLEYLQNILVACGDLLCYPLAFLIIDRVGRKTMFIILSASISVCLIILSLCPPFYVYILVMFFAKSLAAVNSSIVWLYTSEYYPTHIRATGLAFCNFFMRLSLVGVPFLVEYLLKVSLHALVWTLVSFNVMIVSLTFFLKETKGVNVS